MPALHLKCLSDIGKSKIAALTWSESSTQIQTHLRGDSTRAIKYREMSVTTEGHAVSDYLRWHCLLLYVCVCVRVLFCARVCVCVCVDCVGVQGVCVLTVLGVQGECVCGCVLIVC